MTKVLITGASGLIGGVLREGLGDRYELSGVDLRGTDSFDMHVADSTDLDPIRPAFEGKDVVIDLASQPDNEISWEVAYGNNIRCTYNALQAAKENDLRLIATAADDSTSYKTFDWKKRPAALCIGNEGEGLPEVVASRCRESVTIPMRGSAESLNAAVAASILLFEAQS